MDETNDALAATLQRAVELHDAGRLGEAEPLFRQILTLQPEHDLALFRLGVLALQTGRMEEGADLLGRSVAVEPRRAAAHSNLGYALRALGRREAALAAYDRAIALEPDFVDALNNRTNALNELGRHAEALASADRAVTLRPDQAAIHNNRGNALVGLGRGEAALAAFDRARALNPAHPNLHYNRGNALQLLGRNDEALAAYDAALAETPRHVKALSNRGAVLLNLQRPEAAAESLRSAMALAPDLPEPYNNMGDVLLRGGAREAAIASFEAAIARRPDYPEARWNMSLAQLALGRFEEGWRNYQQRWRVPSFLAGPGAQAQAALRERLFPGPTMEQLCGRRLLVLGEQGVGDVLMFASMLPDVLALGAEITLACEPRLHRLFAASFPQLRLIAPDQAEAAAEAVDEVVALGSLGHLFRNRQSDFPGRPYLTAREAVRERWAAALGPKRARLRLGLSWRGGTAATGAASRSLMLPDLAPLLGREDCEFVSLQYGDPTAEVAAFNERLPRPIRLFPPADISDFEDLAGLVQNLDAVVTVQTAIVHLTGALGVRALVMVPHVAEWRYMAAADAMPWYRSVSLFRQAEDRRWEPVIGRVADRLGALA